MKNLLVKDWMTAEVISASPDTAMLEAHKTMREHKIRRMPVVKNGKLVGIVTRSDVRQAEPSAATSLNMWEINYLLAKLHLKDIMTKEVISVRANDTIRTAATLMHDHQIGALPVVDDGDHLVGIITESDIFSILIAWFNEEIGEAGA
ncbi:MAG: CBS domain-containing protein [Anaerolineae bacterium]